MKNRLKQSLLSIIALVLVVSTLNIVLADNFNDDLDEATQLTTDTDEELDSLDEDEEKSLEEDTTDSQEDEDESEEIIDEDQEESKDTEDNDDEKDVEDETSDESKEKVEETPNVENPTDNKETTNGDEKEESKEDSKKDSVMIEEVPTNNLPQNESKTDTTVEPRASDVLITTGPWVQGGSKIEKETSLSYDKTYKTLTISGGSIYPDNRYNTGNTTFTNLPIRYRGEVEKIIFKNVSIHVEPGSTVQVGGMFDKSLLTSLKVVDVSGLDLSQVNSLEGMFAYTNLTQIIGLDKIMSTKIKNVTHMFSNTRTLSSLTLNWGNNFSNVESTSSMFAGTHLGSIVGMENWNISSVTNMNGMFKQSGIPTLNVSWGSKMSKVQNLNSVFEGSSVSTIIGIENWQLNNVNSMISMFEKTNNLKQVNIAWSDGMPKLTTTSKMFSGSAIESLPALNDWGATPQLVDISYMFENTSRLGVDGSTLDVTKLGRNVQDASHLFASSGIRKVTGLVSWTTTMLDTVEYMFYNTTNLTTIPLSWGAQTHSITNMEGMFRGAGAQNIEGIHTWDVRNVKNMSGMFYDMKNMSIIVLDWHQTTSKVETMESMFKSSGFTHIVGIEDWVTTSLHDTQHMFAQTKQINEINLNWGNNMSQLTNMSFMFYNSDITNVMGIDDWDVSSLEYATSAFEGTKKYITGITLAWGTKTSNILSTKDMFKNSSIHSASLNWTPTKLKDASGMFDSTINATIIELPWGSNASSLQDATRMFYNSSASDITGLRLWTTTSLSKLDYMFAETKNLNIEMDLKWGVNSQNITSTSYMFSESAVTNIYLDWLPSKITNVASMFEKTQNLENVEINWGSILQLQYTNNMFKDSNVKSITGLQSWVLRDINKLDSMFSGTANLTTLNLPWGNGTKKVDSMISMFNGSGVSSITGINSWDMSTLGNMNQAFKGTVNLKEINIAWTGTKAPLFTNQYGFNNLFENSGVTKIVLPDINYSHFSYSGVFLNTQIQEITFNKVAANSRMNWDGTFPSPVYSMHPDMIKSNADIWRKEGGNEVFVSGTKMFEELLGKGTNGGTYKRDNTNVPEDPRDINTGKDTPDKDIGDTNPTGNSGPIQLISVPDLEFGAHERGQGIKTINSKTLKPNIQMINKSASDSPWIVTVSLSQFSNGSDSFDGTIYFTNPEYVEGGYARPVSDHISLPTSQSVTSNKGSKTVVSGDGVNGSKWMWIVKWLPSATSESGNDNIRLEIDTNKVNVGSYEATMTWSMEAVPN